MRLYTYRTIISALMFCLSFCAFRKLGKQVFFIAFHDVLPQFHRGFADISSVFQTYS